MAGRYPVPRPSRNLSDLHFPQSAHFSIVIDEFDGKIVKAWHIENSKGEKSPNLATRAGGKHIDLVVGKACRSTAHFISRFYPAMYDETLNGMDSFK